MHLVIVSANVVMFVVCHVLVRTFVGRFPVRLICGSFPGMVNWVVFGIIWHSNNLQPDGVFVAARSTIFARLWTTLQ